MAYGDNEISVRSGAPRELYRFQGTYATYRYTSDSKPHKWQAPDETEEHTYLPITLQRSDINAGTQEDDNLDLNVDLPVTVELVRAYAFNTAPPDLFLTVWRFHTLAEVVPYWTGQVTNISINEGIATLTSPSELGRSMAKNFPNVYYQAPCNHTLYDKRCKVNYADWNAEAQIIAVTDATLFVTLLPLKFDGALLGGEVVMPSGERRMIVQQANMTYKENEEDEGVPATALGINFPFSQANVGTTVTVAAGCDYAYSGDCKNKFNNQLNFGGFPFIPTDNVFETGADPGSKLRVDNTCTMPVFGGVETLIEVSSPNPCNNCTGSNRIIAIKPKQVNPGGVTITTYAPDSAGCFEQAHTIFEINQPGSSVLRGQPLAKFTWTGANDLRAEYYFDAEFDYFGVTPGTGYCGSVGKDGGMMQVAVTKFVDCEVKTIVYGPKEVAGFITTTFSADEG